jgi:hypothetical protein
MFTLFELDSALKNQQGIYDDYKEYAEGNKPYATSPYMQEYYKGLLPNLLNNIDRIRKEIRKIENRMIVRS